MEIKEILLVDGKTPIIASINFILQSNGYLVVVAPDAETASAAMDDYCVDLMLVYLAGHEKEKLTLLRQAKWKFPRTKIMVAGNTRRQPLSIEALRMQVDDCLIAPFTATELCRRVYRCMQKMSISHKRGRSNS